jgi:hypothetical protein
MLALTLNTAGQWAAIVCAGGVLFGFIVGGYKVWNAVQDVRDQVTPNGGSTSKLGDTIARLERSMDDHIVADHTIQTLILDRLDRIDRKVEQGHAK